MRCKDRLPELRQRASRCRPRVAGDTAVDSDLEKDAPPVEEEAPLLPPATTNKELEALLEECGAVHASMATLEEATALLRAIAAHSTYHNDTALQERAEAAAARWSDAAADARARLHALCTAEALDEKGAGGAGVVPRMREVVAGGARRRYAAALAHHHELLHSLRDHKLKLLKYQLALTNAELSEEECQNLLDAKTVAMFVDNIGTQTAEARRQLREAEARHAELLRVEGALREVAQLFQQLADMVAQQQEQIDTVEYYALRATTFVEEGQQQLLQGSVSHRKARKKKMGLLLCLASGFLIVVLVLVYT